MRRFDVTAFRYAVCSWASKRQREMLAVAYDVRTSAPVSDAALDMARKYQRISWNAGMRALKGRE